MDGHWDAAGDAGVTLFVPSVDELQEFKIQTHSFSPQYGWSMGNAVNAITKSGTSSFHGGLFEFLRNSHLDANNFFANRNGVKRPQFKRNQFGFNLGGPVYLPKLWEQKDKTFIFGAFEGLRQQTPITAVYTVPTAEQREGDFSRTFNRGGSMATIYNPFTTRQQGGAFVRDVFPENRIPRETMDPVALKLLPYWPMPNRAGDPVTHQDNFVRALGVPLTGDQYTVRVDHNLTQNQRLFVRWSQKRQFIQGFGAFFGPDNAGGMGLGERHPRWDLGLGYNYAITPAFLVNVTLGWGRWVESYHPQGVPFKPSSLGLPPALDTFGGPGAFPAINVADAQSLGSGSLGRTPREARSYALDATHVRGRHTLSMGFMAIDFRLNTFSSSQASFNFGRTWTQGPNPATADPSTGAGMASLLLGTGSGGITLSAHAAFNKNFYAWYFNDDFKLRRNLTLNLGIRYDLQKAPTDRFNRLSYWVPDRNTLSEPTGLDLKGGLRFTGEGNPRGIYDPQYTNVAPRLGLTYSPAAKLVVRAGFGLFYTPAIEFGPGQGLALSGFSQTTTFVGSIVPYTPYNLLRNPFPDGLLMPPGRSAGDKRGAGGPISAIERERPTPYVEQWTLSLQHQLRSDTMLEAAYVGNHGVKLTFGQGWGGGFDRNQLRPELLSLGNALLEQVPNPFFGVIASGPLAGRTVSRGQLLRPYPQFTSIGAVQPPAGMSTYHALTLSANRRFSRGLQFQASFTASKYLTNTEGPEGWTGFWAWNVQNYHNTALEKSLMIDDVPRSLVLSYIYELPVGRGKTWAPGSRIVDAVIGGWQVAGISTFKSGFPLAIGNANNNSNSFGGNQRPNVIGNPQLEKPAVERWFNTLAFQQPRPFTFGDAPRTMPHLRAQGVNNFDATVEKYWRLWSESSRLQFRTEFFNLFNRTGLFAPNSTFGNPGFARVNQAFPARSIQLGLKLYW